MKAILCAIPVIAALVPVAGAYESAFPRTSVGEVEVKRLGPTKVLVASMNGSYFSNSNRLFSRLFSYIRKNDVAMTVPVQAEIDPGKMLFFVGGDAAERQLKSGDGVAVKTLPERWVASKGARGGYSARNFDKTKRALLEWLDGQKAYEQAGEPYAIYWSGPFVPGFLKRYEVHIPVRPK